MKNKIKDMMYGYIGYIAVTVICLVYIGTSFVSIEQTGKSVKDILYDSALYFAMGILINRILDAQGIMIGSRDPRVYKTMELHNETVNRIYPYMNRMDVWCDIKNSEALYRARRNYLSRYGMRYSDYFEDDGIAKEFPFSKEKTGIYRRMVEHIKYKRYLHAVRMKLTRLSPGLLISDAGETEDPYKMGRSKSEYIKDATKKDIVIKTLIAFLIGYYSVPSLIELNIPDLLLRIWQVGMLFGMGVVSMQSSIIFVTEEYRSRIIKKIDVLQQFEVSIKEEERNEQSKEKPDRQLPAGESGSESIAVAERSGQVLRKRIEEPAAESCDRSSQPSEEPRRIGAEG